MNVSGAVNIVAKAVTGVAVHTGISNASKIILPEAHNLAQAATNTAFVWGMSGVFTNLTWQYVDQTQAGIELLIKKFKEKPVKKTEKVTAE